jgi:glycosyltransferase involved in cell wall biosynthesis
MLAKLFYFIVGVMIFGIVNYVLNTTTNKTNKMIEFSTKQIITEHKLDQGINLIDKKTVIKKITNLPQTTQILSVIPNETNKKLVFDTTLYKNKNTENINFFIPMKILYEGVLLSRSDKDIDINHLNELAQSLPKSDIPYILDIERWDVRTMDNIVANKNIDKYILVIDTMKKARPDLKFGYYAVLPDRDYGAPVSENIIRIIKWEYLNKRLKRLATHVDVVCPSLYTLTDNQEGWKVYATENIKRAREYGKPVYPFIWPQYHNMNVQLGGQAIPSEFWQEQLDLVYQQADGVIIWGGFNTQKEFHGPMEWEENATWWQVTKKFITDQNR